MNALRIRDHPSTLSSSQIVFSFSLTKILVLKRIYLSYRSDKYSSGLTSLASSGAFDPNEGLNLVD